VTDLRDQHAEAVGLIAYELDDPTQAARIIDMLINIGWKPPRGALCHPRRELFARGLCEACYAHHRDRGTHTRFAGVQRRTADFAADYAPLRAEGYTRRQIAERLGMRRNTVDAAYGRAVKAGLLQPDRPEVIGAFTAAVDGRYRTRGTA
jgi:hypothetical protein